MSVATAAAPAAAAGAAPSSSTPAASPATPSNGANPQMPHSEGVQQTPAQAPAPAPKRLSRVEKVDGKETTLEATEDDLWNAYRHRTVAEQRMREAAEIRKREAAERQQLMQRIERIQQDPFALYRDNPEFDELDFLTQRLEQLTNIANLPPEQRQLMMEKQRIAEERAKIEQWHQQQAQAQQEAQDRQALDAIGTRFLQALPKVKLPHDDLTMDLMAKAYFTAQENGYSLNEDELAKATQEQLVSHLDTMSKGMSDEELLNSFPEFRARVHKAIVAEHYRKQGLTPPQQQQETPPQQREAPPQQQEKRLNEYEAHKEMERRAGRRILRTL